MHSSNGGSGGEVGCVETPPPPPRGSALLLELGNLIVSSRTTGRGGPQRTRPHHTHNTDTGGSGAWNDVQLHQRILAAKLLNRSGPERPSTSSGQPPSPITDVQAKVAALSRENSGLIQASAVSSAVARVRRALFIDKHLKCHVEGLWNEHIPLSIEVFLGPDCSDCYLRSLEPHDPETGQNNVTRDGLVLLERWTLSVCHKKAHEKTQQITSQWLLNAVRSQLHFSQISAWNAKIIEDQTTNAKSPQDNKECRQRKLSRETCNFKKLESNCDDPQLLRTERNDHQPETRNLNIAYSLKIPGETYKMAEFGTQPNEHIFPVTDIGSNVYLKVVLESLPRTEDVPIIRCACIISNTGTMKRRRSKECIPGSLSCDEYVPVSEGSEGFRMGASFSPDLTIINPNMGCASGISRRLSIFTNPDNLDGMFSESRGSTPEKLPLDDSGFPCSRSTTPIESCSSKQHFCKKTLLNPSFTLSDNVFQTNYMLVDDRMQTLCSESGKHRCYCDDEPEASNEKSKREQKYLKDAAKQKRKMRKESKLMKLCESEANPSELELESNCDTPGSQAYKRTPTSIAILQASRFGFRQQAFLTLPSRKSICACQQMASIAPCCANPQPCDCEKPNVKMISVSTQTDPISCQCGNILSAKCAECYSLRESSENQMKRSDGSHNLAGISKSMILLQALERTSRLHANNSNSSEINTDDVVSSPHKTDDRISDDDGMTVGANDAMHNCDNNVRISINRECDTYYSLDDSVRVNLNKNNVISECANSSTTEEELFQRTSKNLIKRPKLKRLTPIVDRLDKVLTDRIQIKSSQKKSNDDQQETDDLLLNADDSVFAHMAAKFPRTEESTPLNRRHSSTSDDDFVMYERGDYGTFANQEVYTSYDPTEDFDMKGNESSEVPSTSDMVRFRYRLDSAASMVFHANTGLPLTSSPAPLKRGNTCFDYDSRINSVSSIKSALFHPTVDADQTCWSPGSSPGSPASSLLPPVLCWEAKARPATPPPSLACNETALPMANGKKTRLGPRSGLLGTFEESALKGRLEPAATVAGFTAELGASGAFCPAHKMLPVTVFFYSLGGNAAPYLGHINLGRRGYHVPSSGTIQVTLFNPHGTVVKMFVVPYDLADMPAGCRTFLRQRTLYLPAGQAPPPPSQAHKWLRYLIHLRFLTSKSGKLYLHTDIRIIVSKKADLDTAAAHTALANQSTPEKDSNGRMNRSEACGDLSAILRNRDCGHFEREKPIVAQKEISYELRSFTYTPDNPKFSPR